MSPYNDIVSCAAAAPITTRSIKINQLGYLPERKKLAYVGDYFGDNGGGVWAELVPDLDQSAHA